MAEREGVIKFGTRHETRPLDGARYDDDARALDAWRSVLFTLGGIGQSTARYGGIGYGNASVRVRPSTGPRGARPFLITASQTGAHARVTLRELVLVSRWSMERFTLESAGEALPSSEALTHAAIYDAAPAVRAVLHVHMAEIASRARVLRLPMTTEHAAYGTREMADEVHRLFRETPVDVTRVFAMSGHEDGVVAIGRTLDEAGEALVRVLVRARTHD
jgi:L-ribulose-5-phosphate 4-epimerase